MHRRLLIHNRCRLGPMLLLILACNASAQTLGPPTAVPVGTIVAFMPDLGAGEYSSADDLRHWLAARGWAICDGSEGTPDLHNRMLLGTERPGDTGQSLGSLNHDHEFTGETVRRGPREVRIRDGIRHPVQVPDKNHRHKIDGRTDNADNLPPSTRVLFIMKVRDAAPAQNRRNEHP